MESIKIVAGEHNLRKDEGVQQVAGIRSIHIHEDYDYFYLTSDICILKLAKRLVFRTGEGAVSGVTLPEAGDIFEAGSSGANFAKIL